MGLIARPEDVELDADKMDMMMSSGLQNTGKGMFDELWLYEKPEMSVLL